MATSRQQGDIGAGPELVEMSGKGDEVIPPPYASQRPNGVEPESGSPSLQPRDVDSQCDDDDESASSDYPGETSESDSDYDVFLKSTRNPSFSNHRPPLPMSMTLFASVMNTLDRERKAVEQLEVGLASHKVEIEKAMREMNNFYDIQSGRLNDMMVNYRGNHCPSGDDDFLTAVQEAYRKITRHMELLKAPKTIEEFEKFKKDDSLHLYGELIALLEVFCDRDASKQERLRAAEKFQENTVKSMSLPQALVSLLGKIIYVAVGLACGVAIGALAGYNVGVWNDVTSFYATAVRHFNEPVQGIALNCLLGTAGAAALLGGLFARRAFSCEPSVQEKVATEAIKLARA